MLCLPRQACLRRTDIHEGFVYDEKTAPDVQFVAQCKEFLFANDPPVRIVRVDHNREVAAMLEGRIRTGDHGCRAHRFGRRDRDHRRLSGLAVAINRPPGDLDGSLHLDIGAPLERWECRSRSETDTWSYYSFAPRCDRRCCGPGHRARTSDSAIWYGRGRHAL